MSPASTPGGACLPDRLSVLVADDNDDFASNVAELVRMQRFEPFTVRTYSAALSALARSEFDVAVVDHRLPDGNGTDFLIRARQLRPDLVTVIVTAYASLDTTVAALNEGAFAFVAKDAESERLLDAIHRASQTAVLRRENRQLREIQAAILSALPDQLMLVDDTLRVRSVNRRDAVLCAPTVDGHLPRRLSELLNPIVSEKLDFARLVAHAGTASAAPATITVRDPATDTARIFAVDASLLTHEPEHLTLIRISELTDRLELERKLSDSESLAKLGRLTSVIAHEIRNPIAGIRALCQVLLRRFEPSDTDHENVREMMTLADRMTATLGDLLNYARPRSRETAPVAIDELAKEVVRESRRWPACEARHLDLEVAPGSAPTVVGDRDRLFSALSNLVENALHAVREGGRVLLRVGVEDDGKSCRITVEDDGPGVDVAIASRIFEPFITKKPRGTGLGLSIVKKIVDGHGGRIEVDRSPTLGGASFSVVLPLSRSSATAS